MIKFTKKETFFLISKTNIKSYERTRIKKKIKFCRIKPQMAEESLEGNFFWQLNLQTVSVKFLVTTKTKSYSYLF